MDRSMCALRSPWTPRASVLPPSFSLLPLSPPVFFLFSCAREARTERERERREIHTVCVVRRVVPCGSRARPRARNR